MGWSITLIIASLRREAIIRMQWDFVICRRDLTFNFIAELKQWFDPHDFVYVINCIVKTLVFKWLLINANLILVFNYQD